MKKLALALVCLVSVAFFASCDPEEVVTNPTIEVVATDGYLQNNDIIDVNVEYPIGFKAASPSNDVELSKFYIDINGVRMVDSVISGTTFTYDDVLSYDERDIIDTLEIVATVVTEKEASTSVSMTVYVNQTLVPEAFEWRRDNGADGTGLAEFGLFWEKNITKTYAKIEALEGAKLVIFEPEVWTNTTTEAEKVALFSEALGVASFTSVSTTASDDYDLVIGTYYNDEYRLMHITHCNVYERGWHFVITGEWK